MKKLTPARIQKAIQHRMKRYSTSMKSANVISQSFASPTALRMHALQTSRVETSFAYTVKVPKNLVIANTNLRIGNLQQFAIVRKSDSLQISATFSAPINEGYFAWAVAKLISPALISSAAVSWDFQTSSLVQTAGKRLVLGPLAETDAKVMEAENLHSSSSDTAQFDIALFNPIGLRLKKALDNPKIAQIEIANDFKLDGAVRSVDEFLVADLRRFAGAVVKLSNTAHLNWISGLAATGLVLEVDGDLTGLDAALQSLLKTPLPTSSDSLADKLNWLWRSENQRRIALLEHTAVWESKNYPTVDILLVTNRINMIPTALDQIAKQTYPNFRIRLGAHNISQTDLEGAISAAAKRLGTKLETHLFTESETLGAIYGKLTEQSSADYIAKFDDDDLYGPNHLLDAIISMQYSGAGLFGRTPNLTWLETTGELLLRPFGDEEVFNKYIIGPTMVVRRSALLEVGGWRPTPWAVDKALIDRFIQLGGGVYRAGAFGWIYVRHDQGHTWLRDESHFRNQAEIVWSGTDALELKQQVLGE